MINLIHPIADQLSTHSRGSSLHSSNVYILAISEKMSRTIYISFYLNLYRQILCPPSHLIVTKNHACTKTPSLNGQISICQAQYWIQPESIKTYHSFLKPISSHANIRQRCTRINLILRFFSERNSNGVTKPVLLKTQVVSCFR